ncbi:MAG TPA: DUF2807 domain-containing protein [Paludibacter sp.]|nr:DUF2807 domain-containing protein [Paludibacter sp.]
MKKTLTVNLNNIVFHIDDDAFEMLQTYLADVERYLSEDEKREVMADIEARVAELFTERLQKNKNVVNIEDVGEIINVLGKPSQFAGTEDEDEKADNPKSDKKKSRHFYRDPENAIIGGVSSGISAYFGWDVTWVRIALVILTLISAGNMVLVYLLVWIVAPRATTASQRLEMQGEDVTVDSIKEEIKNVKNYVESDKFKQGASSFGEKFVDFMRGLFKVVFGFFGAVFGFVGMIIVGVLILVLLMLIFNPGFVNGFSPEVTANWALLTPEKGVMLIISLLLVIGCPIFMLVYWIIQLVSGHRNLSHTTSIIVFILWLAGLFMFYSVGAQTFINWRNSDKPFSFRFHDSNSPVIDETRICEDFSEIEISGNIELTIIQDSIQQIVVSAPEDIMSGVITSVDYGKLKIYSENILLNNSIKVTVHQDSLFRLEANGASKIKTFALFSSSKLLLELSGASQADMDLNISDFTEVDINGASHAQIKGNTFSGKYYLSGASRMDANQFIAAKVDVEASGASKADVYSSESIDAEASGASQINCEGSPKNVRKSDNGASNVNIK